MWEVISDMTSTFGANHSIYLSLSSLWGTGSHYCAHFFPLYIFIPLNIFQQHSLGPVDFAQALRVYVVVCWHRWTQQQPNGLSLAL